MEFWDAYNEQCEIIDGITLIRGEKIPNGIYHLVSDIIVKHADGSYLLMQRDKEKQFGGMEGMSYKEYQITLEPGSYQTNLPRLVVLSVTTPFMLNFFAKQIVRRIVLFFRKEKLLHTNGFQEKNFFL